MKQRYDLKKSEFKPGYWVCTDIENLILCTFKNGDFNGDQDFKTLEDFNPANFMELAKLAREMGDWLNENHSDKIF